MKFKDKATLKEVNKISEILTYIVNKYDIKSESLNTLKETLIKRCGATLKEDLIDNTSRAEKSPAEPLNSIDGNEEDSETQQVAFGITGLLGNAIQNAWNNVGEYNSILATISSMGDLQELEVEKISSIISSILDDEMIKIGKLEDALRVVQPSTDITNTPTKVEEQLYTDNSVKTPKDPFKMSEIDFLRVFEESMGFNWSQSMICDNVWDRLVAYLNASNVSASYRSGIIRVNNKKIFQIIYDHSGRNEWAIDEVKTFNCTNLKLTYDYTTIGEGQDYLYYVEHYGVEYAEKYKPTWLKIEDTDTELLESKLDEKIYSIGNKKYVDFDDNEVIPHLYKKISDEAYDNLIELDFSRLSPGRKGLEIEVDEDVYYAYDKLSSSSHDEPLYYEVTERGNAYAYHLNVEGRYDLLLYYIFEYAQKYLKIEPENITQEVLDGIDKVDFLRMMEEDYEDEIYELIHYLLDEEILDDFDIQWYED